MTAIKNFIMGLITEADNKTPCGLRILAYAGVAMLVYKGATAGTLDYKDWGTGFGFALAAAGGAIWAKSKGGDAPIQK